MTSNLETSLPNRYKRWWTFYFLGAFSSISLVVIIILLLIDLQPNGPFPNYFPSGDDFFSVPYKTGNYGPHGAYVISVDIGTKPSSIYSMLDTGSGNAWFKEKSSFTSQSLTFKRFSTPFSMIYMTGEVSGYVGKDDMTVRHGTSLFSWSQSFGVATSVANMALDSIVGLSRGVGDLCVLRSWELKESVIGFYYDPATWKGFFMAGFVNETQYCKPGSSMIYIDGLSDYYWLGQIGLEINGKNLGNNLNAVFDTGSTYMIVSEALFASIMSSARDTDSCATPLMVLVIGNTRFPIPPPILRTPARDCELRVSSFTPSEFSYDLIVGATFLINYYVVHELNGNRMGFCEPAPNLTELTSRRLSEIEDPLIAMLDDPYRSKFRF
jgi:hypothetical protein